ncbi:MAG: hypothetical protein ACQEQ4_09110, partial [Fibrobacterota bacterium]
RNFMLLPAKLVKSGRQKRLDISVCEKKWENIKRGYERIISWLKSNAPQLDLGATFTDFAISFQDHFTPKINLNCGI